jgi:hypothetical protein
MRQRSLTLLLLCPTDHDRSQSTNTKCVIRTQLPLGLSLDAGSVRE